MEKEKNSKQEHHGEVLLGWSFEEYEKPDRSTRWYFIATLIGGALLLYSLWTANYIFGVVIVLIALVYFLMEVNDAPDVSCEITTSGIKIGRKFLKYKELENFWIVYKPGQTHRVFFEPAVFTIGELSAPLGNLDPLQIRELLLQYLPESEEHDDEPLSNQLGRMLKL